MTAIPPVNFAEFFCLNPLDLYNSADLKGLATQAAPRRQLQILARHPDRPAVEVRLCEDGSRAWLPIEQLSQLERAGHPYHPTIRERGEIEVEIPQIIDFMTAAMSVPHEYLWGGTVSPHYDCSGLMQAAFAASGIWLPRDSYQQEAFTIRIEVADLLAGDLIFFGDKRVDHVALYLGEGHYIHSSGKAMGRNGIAIDPLSDREGDAISRRYYQKFWSCGRVMESYCPSER